MTEEEKFKEAEIMLLYWTMSVTHERGYLDFKCEDPRYIVRLIAMREYVTIYKLDIRKGFPDRVIGGFRKLRDGRFQVYNRELGWADWHTI